MSKVLWYAGVCDQALNRITSWYRYYNQGEIFGTRPRLSANAAEIETVTTVRRHYLQWHTEELDHLIRMVEALRPKWRVTLMLQKTREMLKIGRLCPGGARLVAMDFYKQDVADLLSLLQEVRSGKKESLSGLLEEQRQKGKDIWE